jgi:hypothetical protein
METDLLLTVDNAMAGKKISFTNYPISQPFDSPA